MEYLSDKPRCHVYYPIAKETARLPRQWVVNIAYSVIGAPFREWVRERVEARNQAVIEKQNLMIDVD